ncbi:MAG: hypothetical protein IT319_07485 [Anaerolineae bacterium]|nr:hypothetical protein [Anaerolineae bacterium]
MRQFALFLLALLASACNLSTQPATPTALATPLATEELILPPDVTVTPLPGIAATSAGTPGATRTPFGSDSAPTTQPLATNGGFPTPATGERGEITSPANGASVSGAPLYVSGVVHNLPEDQFTMQVFDPDGEALTGAQTITLGNPNHVADVPWSASITINDYTGAAQIRITARTADGTDAVIAAANVIIAPGSSVSPVQPSSGSAVAGVPSPANGSSASGDPITVTGTAGGMADNQFTLLLLSGDGTVLNSQLITLTGAEQNVVPWSATLGTSGYHGRAEIRAVVVRDGQQVTLTSITVNLQ